MNVKNKKVLVTGADGFIGSHLVEELVLGGADVKAFVYYNSFDSWGGLDTFSREILEKIEVFTGDIRDPNGVEEAVKDRDVVFHLAALIGIPFSYNSPDSYVDTNIKGTLNVLQAAKKNQIEKVIHTSTSEVYGTAQYVPIDEKHPIHPQSPYAATKSAADELALSFHRSFNLPVSIVRPFNTFGPRQSARAIIPTIISQIYSGNRSIKLGNLDAKRDFNYVMNTVQGFISVAEQEGTEGEIFNIGSGEEISIGELADKLFQLTDTNMSIERDQQRIRPEKSEVGRLLCDSSKFKQYCSLNSHIPLEEGLQKTCDWIKNNIKRYKTEIYNI